MLADELRTLNKEPCTPCVLPLKKHSVGCTAVRCTPAYSLDKHEVAYSGLYRYTAYNLNTHMMTRLF